MRYFVTSIVMGPGISLCCILAFVTAQQSQPLQPVQKTIQEVVPGQQPTEVTTRQTQANPPVVATNSFPLGESLMRRRLEEPISINSNHEPLGKTLAVFGEKFGIGFVADGKIMELPVTLQTGTRAVSARSALLLLLEPLGLTFRIDPTGNVIEIVSKRTITQEADNSQPKLSVASSSISTSAAKYKEQELELRIAGVLNDLKQAIETNLNAPGSEPLTDVTRNRFAYKLTPLLEEQFVLRQTVRAQELSRLRAELARMEKIHNERESKKAEIIRDRQNQLLKEVTGMGWGLSKDSTAASSSIQPQSSVPSEDPDMSSKQSEKNPLGPAEK